MSTNQVKREENVLGRGKVNTESAIVRSLGFIVMAMAGTLNMKPTTYYLNFSDYIMENDLENSKSRGRNVREGCLMQAEMVADSGKWREADEFSRYLRKCPTGLGQ